MTRLAPLCLCLLTWSTCFSPPQKHPGRYPRPLYWFWTAATLKDDRWAAEAQDLARRGPCDLVFATPRYPWPAAGGIDFLDTKRFLPIFRRAASLLARGGVRLAVDLRCYPGLREPVPPAQAQELLEVIPARLDGRGRTRIRPAPDPALFPAVTPRVSSQFFLAWETGTGRPLPAVTGRLEADGTLALEGPPNETVLAVIRHRYNHPDMFSGVFAALFTRALRAYGRVGLAGAGLDEFAYLPMRGDAWPRFIFYSEGTATAYRTRFRRNLVADLGLVYGGRDPAARIAAVNRYNLLHREAIAAVEQAFYHTVKRELGREAFVGVHPTNQTQSDFNAKELRLTFLDWWAVPRDFGQTDEATPMPVRLGLALKAGGPVWYHMFYHHDERAIFAELARCARYGGRLHYHAYGDRRFGVPLEKKGLLERLRAAEARLAVLDRHVRGVPLLDGLVLLGWPHLVAWPVAAGENRYRDAMTFLRALWRRGFRMCAVPTYEIASGALRLERGRPVYGGRTFKEVIVWQPEFATEATLAFLTALGRSPRVRVFVVGDLTRDFAGRPARLPPTLVRVRAEEVLRRPPPKRPDDGVAYPGGLRVYVDAESLATGRPAVRTLRVGNKRFSFRFAGALVLETKPGRPPQRLP